MPKELSPPFLPVYLEDVLNFYIKVKTQWRVFSGGFGGFLIGLDYTAVIQTAKIYNFKLDELKMDILREIESFYINRRESDGK